MGAQYTTLSISLEGKHDLFNKRCWHNWLSIILAMCRFWICLVSDSFPVLLLCSEYSSWAPCRLRFPVSLDKWSGWVLVRRLWRISGVSVGKEKTRYFSASNGTLAAARLFIFMMASSCTTGLLGTPASIKKIYQ